MDQRLERLKKSKHHTGTVTRRAASIQAAARETSAENGPSPSWCRPGLSLHSAGPGGAYPLRPVRQMTTCALFQHEPAFASWTRAGPPALHTEWQIGVVSTPPVRVFIGDLRLT